MKKKFSLIELIVVICVLGLLVAIVIPNINDFKSKANQAAIISNARVLQTTMDTYSIDNQGNYPFTEQPTILNPKQIDSKNLIPNYLIKETKTGYYWLDYQGKVWYSDIDIPSDIKNTGTEFIWTGPENATKYNIYVVQANPTTSSLSKNTLKLIKENTTKTTFDSTDGYNKNETYLVSAISPKDFETVPVGPTQSQPPETNNSVPISKTPKGYTEDLTSPTGIISATSYFDDRVPKRAFDNVTGNYFNTAWESNAITPTRAASWLMYDFETPKRIEKYTLTSSFGVSTPKSWVLQASNDNATWINVDEQTNQINWPKDYPEKREYTFSNQNSYRYYRLYITSTNGDNFIIVGEMEMMEAIY